MSYIGRNIRKIRSVKNLSQAKFAELFNLARPSVGAYEEGRSEPKIETLIQIAKHFDLSIDLLLTKEITVNQLYHFDLEGTSTLLDKKEEIPATGIPVLEGKDWLNYVLGQRKADFLSRLPKVQVPGVKEEDHLVFSLTENQGGSGAGLKKGDWLICKKKALNELEEGKLVVLFHSRKAYVLRFTAIVQGQLKLSLWENPGEHIVLEETGLEECWEVRKRITNDLAEPHLLDRRVLKLEEQMEQLLKGLN
ncbi:helix-turn-helix transcriptional regulator [Persicobacter diffluens]|uniref:HTH cro/C1-type domain-containing protein n=1 Tax=Persicobacter diffluens TaxID=981 RepID=A0AAN4VVK0_9BACT|nr:hypothetical protein PEDI_14660 [Persicobacter diffluens]